MKYGYEIQDNRAKEIYEGLIERAIRKLPESYVPYSQFHVAAALLGSDGSITEGINIENASYPATNCAERTAFFTAVCGGKRGFSAIAVVGCKEDWLSQEAYRKAGRLPDYCPPCGVCRQVMREFTDPETFQIILAKSKEDYKVFTLKELLPESFGPENL